MTVGDIMVEPVVTVAPDASVAEAQRLLEKVRVRHLPVLDGGLLVGIVSEGDLQGAVREMIPIREVMTRTVFVLSPDTPVRQAARVFRERRVRAMPVLKGRELIGMVSVVDVLRVLAE